ncbi:MAG: hypothetical protein JW838_06170 [Spirochaetes bacterium]|nr:hypothetical protein [Spirochaetota bacterium]
MEKVLEQLTSGRRFHIIIPLLILVFTGMRLVHINADAPQELTRSAAIYTDEGFKTYEARNAALFGDRKWTPEDQYEGWADKSPVTNIPYRLLFTRFGAGYASIRILPIVYAALTMILLVIFLTRTYDRATALTGLTLFGINYFTAMFNRLGLYESHLLFFIMLALFGFSEAFRPDPRGGGSDAVTPGRTVAGLLPRLAFLLVGLAGVGAGFFIKRNMLVIIPAITPALILVWGARRGWTPGTLNRLLGAFIAAAALGYLLIAHLYALRVTLAFSLMSIQVFGKPLASLLPFTAFDPIRNVAGKGLFMEFVLLHPLTLFAACSYALWTLHRYVFTDRREKTTDLILSCWLLFGIAFITVMYYSPSRYYLLFAVPLVTLAARFILRLPETDIASYFSLKKPFPHNLIFGAFILCAALYTGITLVFHAIPSSVKNSLVDRLYPSFLKGDFSEGIPVIAAVAATCILCTAATIACRKRLLAIIGKTNFPALFLTALMALQLFQYGRWLIFPDYRVHRASLELGRDLPENAVIAGSWSGGLVVENRLRALIVQSLIPYNHNLIKKVLHDIPIQVNRLEDGARQTVYEGGIPVYLAVCRNVIFEKAITEIYQEHITPERLEKRFRFGYFNVEIYRMKKFKTEAKNEVLDLFRRFL